jgi:hypothetical protein
MMLDRPAVLLRLGARLRHRVGAVKKEDCDLLVCLPSGVDCTMWALAGREAQPPNEVVSVMMQYVVGHCSSTDLACDPRKGNQCFMMSRPLAELG